MIRGAWYGSKNTPDFTIDIPSFLPWPYGLFLLPVSTMAAWALFRGVSCPPGDPQHGTVPGTVRAVPTPGADVCFERDISDFLLRIFFIS
jgi:hypothetical protein